MCGRGYVAIVNEPLPPHQINGVVAVVVVAVSAPAATVPEAGRDRKGAGVLPIVSSAKTLPGMAHTLAVGESTPGWFDGDECPSV